MTTLNAVMPKTFETPSPPLSSSVAGHLEGVSSSDRDPVGRSREISRVLGVVLVLNLLVAVAKLGSGFISGSVAMSADRFNSLLEGFANVVSLAGIAVAERAGLKGADSIVSFIVAGMIGWAAWGILRETSLVLTDAVTHIDPRLVLATIVSAPGSTTARNLRVRTSGELNWAEVHITVDPNLTVKSAHDVATNVEDAIRKNAGPETRTIVHVEPAEPPLTRPDPIPGDEHHIESAPRS